MKKAVTDAIDQEKNTYTLEPDAKPLRVYISIMEDFLARLKKQSFKIKNSLAIPVELSIRKLENLENEQSKIDFFF